jgi:protein-S-isoprenylcysteine O-methyltransferase Ste14
MSLQLFIISSIFLIVLGFIVFRVIVRREYKSKGKLNWVGSTSEFVIFALHINFSYSFLNVSWPWWPDMPENQIQKIAGISLFTLGLILTVLSMGYLGFKKAFGVNTDGLRNTGVYSYSRNPQMVFYTVLVLSVAILWLSWYAVVWFILYLIIGHFMVKTEEEHLENVYGESYKQYCQEVPRYLIFK